jgi:hypothetical protein
MPKMKSVVIVEWIDSSTINKGGWTYLDQVNPQPCCECVSVGWIVRQDKHSIVLAADETIDGPIGRLLAIPRKCITKISSFRKKQT